MMSPYQARRGQLETYFDRTASDAWAKLTSDAPVSGIRATVRAGRDRMRATLLSWLPDDMRGLRLLDAGCGTGALSVEAARRGAHVTAIDLSATLVALAQERAPRDLGEGRIDFAVGDMMAPDMAMFDHIVAMDSLIHYKPAPATPLLTTMLAMGRLFPRSDRSPAIVPVRPKRLVRRTTATPQMQAWLGGRDHRISAAFYMSHALELVHR